MDNRTKKSTIRRNSLTDFPEDVLIEILLRLPLKTLLACRFVCRKFYNLTSPSSNFNSLYSRRATQALIIQFRDNRWNPSHYLDMFDPEADPARGLDFSTKIRFNIPEVCETYGLALMNSCNGLLYLSGASYNDSNSIIFNPLTNEYITLPSWDINGIMEIKVRLLLLGFISASNRYKVVGIFQTRVDGPCHVQVHEVGSGWWRGVKTGRYLGSGGCFGLFTNATYLNGAAYMIWNSQGSSMLVCFDFDKEQFGEITLPVDQSLLQSSDCTLSSGVLRERLFVGLHIHRRCFSWERMDVWFMRNGDGDGDLWSKEFSIDSSASPMLIRSFNIIRPLRVLSNGKILMISGNHQLFCYDPHNNTTMFVELELDPVEHLREPVTLIPSFVSLQDQLSIDQDEDG